MKKQPENLVLLTDLMERLKWPGSTRSITRPAVYDYLEQLRITAKNKKGVGPGKYSRACVTGEQASAVEKAFRARHWRMFAKAKQP